MRKIFTFLIFACAAVFTNAHELHFSITNIDVYPDSIGIAIRITTNDLLAAINKTQDNQIHTEVELTESQITKSQHYFISHFFISVNSEKLNLLFNSAKFDGINYWFYFKVTEVKNIESFVLTNKLFIETFNNQKNLVTIKCGVKEAGFNFTVEEFEKTISLK
ncbi:MAG: hypothetical protein JEZ09_10815 [Salinivirgaceae bacterium]|nr:hypothetical protein [Salinivirgaceae bacterium]